MARNPADLAAKASWLPEDRLTALGADFQPEPPGEPHVVVDRNLATGTRPQPAR